MSYRDLFPSDEAFSAWVRQVNDFMAAQQRAQPVFGPSISIGDLRLDAVTIGTTVHLYATNTITGAVVLIV